MPSHPAGLRDRAHPDPDPVAHLGVTHVDMPLTPERVWRAIQVAAGAGR